MNWKPRIEETLRIQASSARFISALHERIRSGLLTNQSRQRENYSIVESTPKIIQVRAIGWWTATNVGLNDLNLNFADPGIIHFRLDFWRWSVYCLGLSLALGLGGALTFLMIDIRDYITDHSGSRIPGLSIQQNMYFAWGILSFWALIWPWILIALHKRTLRRLIVRLVGEIDANAINDSQQAG